MNNFARLELSGELSLRGAAELKTRLAAALERRAPLVITTSGIDTVDAGGLQILVAAQKSADAAGTSMQVTAAATEPVGRALIAAGFHAPDGRPLIPQARTWTLTSEAR